eukprot:CAMPEP_0170601074 /NCGR_PEP_ID=MMETSP0224-20130122/17668_1 /TAXON_ID=285029 /ORGANISM="Togula jolla, Strain CCCM 725" /LENGTH=215 /DNA_ID=CAMNT_0010925831 /DNA_START=183 /DNA_END=829 /DNA_ORIENTATION=-
MGECSNGCGECVGGLMAGYWLPNDVIAEPVPRSHGWFNPCSAVNRSPGRTCSNLRMKSCAPFDTFLHADSGKPMSPLDDLPVELVQNLVEEGQRSAKDHVSDHPAGPDVNFSAILLLLDHLWRKVEVGTAYRMRPRQPPWVVLGDPGQTEVRDLDLNVVHLTRQEDIFRLQVSMHDASAVDICHCLKQVPHERFSFMLRVELLLLNAVVELPALT